MALYLGDKKVAVTNTIEKQVPSMKAFFEAGGKCAYSGATSFEGCWQYDDTENVTDCFYFFLNCSSLTTLPPKMNLRKAKRLTSMFSLCFKLTMCPQLDLSAIMTETKEMFSQCSELTFVPLFDTSEVTNMYQMFYGCKKITTVPKFDTSKVTDMAGMFASCSSLISVPEFNTSNVTKIDAFCSSCSSLLSVPLLDISKVTDIRSMFFKCSSLVEIPKFNLLNVTNTYDIFYGCTSLEQIHMININASLDISPSTKFTREALLEIIGNLVAQTSGSKKLTMGSTNLAKLTDEDKKIATDKGWTLA